MSLVSSSASGFLLLQVFGLAASFHQVVSSVSASPMQAIEAVMELCAMRHLVYSMGVQISWVLHAAVLLKVQGSLVAGVARSSNARCMVLRLDTSGPNMFGRSDVKTVSRPWVKIHDEGNSGLQVFFWKDYLAPKNPSKDRLDLILH